MTAWPTPQAELAGWLAVLASTRQHEQIVQRRSLPGSVIDMELAIGALVAAATGREHAVAMLIAMRCEADRSPGLDAPDVALRAWSARWFTYRNTIQLAEDVLVHQHASRSAISWGRQAS